MALPQPLHIFRKDVRHLWPETLVVLALFVAFAWSAPSRWTDSPYSAAAPLLSGFLKVLMPISWLVVISRLIHDEPLVGDRQFWTSRPYHWASLLASKLLFLVVFLYIPFLLMQAYLLKHAGLYPTTAIPALLHNLLLLTVIIVIPITALAAVTATFARLLLTVLGAMLYVIALSLFFAWIAFQHMPPPALKPILIGIFILLPAIALVYQYATRKTNVARIMLAATPLVILLLLFLTPATALIRSAYPALAGASDPKLGSLPDEYAPKDPKPGELIDFRGNTQVTLPFTVAGVDKDSNYVIQGVSISLNSSGTRFDSPYLSTTGQINAGAPFALVNLPMPIAVFNKVKSTPTDVHVSLATDHLKAEPMQAWKATLLPFAVPGHGLCSFSSQNPSANPVCRYPFATPELNLVSAPLAVGSCSQPQGGQSIPGSATIGGEPGLLDFDPVITAPLTLRPRQQTPPGMSFALCPGTPLNFVEAHSVGHARFEFDEKHIVLDNYAARIPPPSAQQPGMDQFQQGPPR